jgi:hypothetical protein
MSILSTTYASAIEQAFCLGILDRVNYNLLRSSSAQAQQTINKANLCSAEYDRASQSQKANIEVGYKLFTGSASQSADEVKEHQKQMCESKYGEYWYSQSASSEQRVAVIEALQSVDRCIELSRKNKLDISTTISEDNKDVNFVIKWNDTGTLRINYAGPSPWNAAQCYVKGIPVQRASDLSTQLQSVTGWTFSCKRQSKAVTINQETINCVEPMIVSIDTDRVAESIIIPRACDADYLISRAKQVEDKVEKLSKDIEESRSKLAALAATTQLFKENNDADRKAVSYIFIKENECPAGWSKIGRSGFLVETGAKAVAFGPGGPYGAGEWTWTHPILCRRN